MTPFSDQNAAGAGRSSLSLLDAARLYARKGRYEDALQLLTYAASDADQPCRKVDLLDLQGRIFAQQGCFLKAEKCWQAALALEPSNAACAAALARIRRQRMPLGFSQAVPLALIALSVVALMLYQIHASVSGYKNLQRAVVGDVDTLRKDLERLNGRVEAGEEQVRAHVDRAILPLQRSQRELADTGSRTMEHLSALQAGLDGYMAQANANDKALLQSVASRLEAIRTSAMKSLSDMNREQADRQTQIAALTDRLAAFESDTHQQLLDLNTQMQQAFEQVAHASDIGALQQRIADLDQRVVQLNTENNGGRSRK